METGTRLTSARAVAGLLLVAVGALLLLRLLGVDVEIWKPAWALIFAAAGLALLAPYAVDRSDAWALVPGLALLGLAGAGGLQSVAPGLEESWGGPIFLGGVGLGFLSLYVARRDGWWAVIPAGGFLTLAVVSWLSNAHRGADTGGVFFLGLAVTFVAVYLLPAGRVGEGGRRSWALVVALPFFALAGVVFAAGGSAFNYVWPALLILAGLRLVLRPSHR